MNGLLNKVMYTCDKARDFMYDFLDESLPTLTSIRFHLHLNLCAECREYLFLYKKAANAGEFRKEHPAPDAFLTSTLEFLKKEGITGEDSGLEENGSEEDRLEENP